MTGAGKDERAAKNESEAKIARETANRVQPRQSKAALH